MRTTGEKYSKKRFIYKDVLGQTGRHFTGIVGARGIGKTVLLKQLARESTDTFYISLDSIATLDLFETVKSLSETYGMKQVLLDEIHFNRDYLQDLKKIYDFLDVHIIFTSSASLAIHDTSYDLSRRIKLLTMHPFSFREYIFFRENIELPRLTFDDILQKKWRPEHFRLSTHFDAYLRGGLLPFALEEPEVFDLLKNVIQKILTRDIPTINSLRIDELQVIEKLISFVGKSAVDGINYSSLSRNLGITKYKAEHYVRLLDKAFVLNVVLPAGSNVLKEPKILLNLPIRLLYRDWDEAVGGIREDFFVQSILMQSFKVHYLKSTRGTKTPDYLVQSSEDEFVVEIGGRGKGREQFKGIDKKKNLILTHSDLVDNLRRPLFLVGYL